MTKRGLIIIIISAAIMAFLRAEYKPDIVESTDIERLKTLEKELYRLSTHKHIKEKKISEIFSFLWSRRMIRISPILERINIDIIAFGGGRNTQGAFYSPNNDYTLNPYAYIGLQAQLKLIDPKEHREKQEQILKQRADMLTLLRNLQQKKAERAHSNTQIRILMLKEQRLKVRVYNAVSNLDERIKNLEELHEENKKNDILKVEIENLEERILDLIEFDYRKELKQKLESL